MSESTGVILDATGKPAARARADGPCPKCGADKERRQESSGFGAVRIVVCGQCGMELSRGAR